MLSIALASPALGYFAPAPAVPVRAQPTMKEGGYMYDNPYAPAGMGREFIDAEGARKPLDDYVGVSEELNLAAFFKGEPLGPAWDPMGFSKLSKVSANNPDVAFLREAELKHGRIAMLAFVGIVITNGGVHFGGAPFVAAADAGWPDALGAIQKASPSIYGQMIGAVAIVEGVSNSNRAKKSNINWWGEQMPRPRSSMWRLLAGRGVWTAPWSGLPVSQRAMRAPRRVQAALCSTLTTLRCVCVCVQMVCGSASARAASSRATSDGTRSS